MAYGFRIGVDRPPVERELVERFGRIPVACISDAMQRMVAAGGRIRPMGPPRLLGIARTVKTAPGDNLMVHKAIAMAKPGEVIVVDAGGDLTNAIMGERMLEVCAQRQVAGVVINGAVRDAETLRDHSVPVFAAGVTHRGPYKNGPGEINYPVAIDGMVVESGDVVVGDADGIICIPARDALAVCIDAEKKFTKENDTAPGVPSWLDDTLRKLGCEMTN